MIFRSKISQLQRRSAPTGWPECSGMGGPDITGISKNAEKVGYLRAVQGFSMNFSSHIYLSLGRIISEMLEAEAHRNGLNLLDTWKGFHELNEILLKGFSTVATSFLRTREELIQEKVNHLQEKS